MSTKGGRYEREMCRMFSLWWSEGRSEDDLLWRTAGSGGRAKRRGREGKRTHGHAGDICATHPDAEPLIKCLTIELKRGYNKFTFVDALDKGPSAAVQEWESWFAQAVESHRQAGSLSWLIIQRRDKRRAVVFFPDSFFAKLRAESGRFSEVVYPSAVIRFSQVCGPHFVVNHKVYCMLLDDFLEEVRPEDIRAIMSKMND